MTTTMKFRTQFENYKPNGIAVGNKWRKLYQYKVKKDNPYSFECEEVGKTNIEKEINEAWDPDWDLNTIMEKLSKNEEIILPHINEMDYDDFTNEIKYPKTIYDLKENAEKSEQLLQKLENELNTNKEEANNNGNKLPKQEHEIPESSNTTTQTQ